MGQCVLVADPAFFDLSRLAQVIASVENIPLADAAQSGRGRWGILAKDIDRGAIERWTRAAAPIALRTVDGSALVTPPEPQPIRKLSFSPEHLTLEPPSGPPITLPPTSPVLIAACIFDEEHTRTTRKEEGPSVGQRVASAGIFLATGLPISVGPKKQVVEKTQVQSERRLLLDLLVRDPVRRLRIEGDRLDYSCLGRDKQYNTLGNFKQLLKNIAGLVPKAWQNHGARMLLEGRPFTEMGYRGAVDLDHELRWLLTLQSL